MANLSALAAARHAVLARAGWDVDEKGGGQVTLLEGALNLVHEIGTNGAM